MSDQMTFGWAREPDSPAPLAETLRGRMHRLAERGACIGTSSWKYPGWLGRLYQPHRYHVRGRFSKRRFEAECLREYARVFPTVCGDFAFYQFPSADFWAGLFDQLPDHYRFSLKIPEQVTVETWPNLPRYGRLAGTANGHFMDAALLGGELLDRLEPYRDKLGVLIFQFGTLRHAMSEPPAFARALDDLLAALPTRRFRFAVEVRNPAFLDAPYPHLEVLRRHGVAHCFNSWTRMPPIDRQIALPAAFTAAHLVARFLLRPGRAYQQAVDQFSPYQEIRDPYPAGRQALTDLIRMAMPDVRTLFAFVNNRFEGNALQTIDLATRDLA